MSIKMTDNTDKFVRGMDDAITRGLKAIGATAEAHAKDSLTEQGAVDTGLLRNSITYAISGEKTAISQYKASKNNKNGELETGEYSGTAPKDKDKAVYVGTNVHYAPYIELGTHKMPPRPYLRPAATQHSNEYRKLLKESMENA